MRNPSSNAYSYSHWSDSDGYCDSNGNRNRNSHGHGHGDCDCRAEVDADAEAASHTRPTPVASLVNRLKCGDSCGLTTSSPALEYLADTYLKLPDAILRISCRKT